MQKPIFLSQIKDKIKDCRISDETVRICFAIIDFLSNDLDKKTHLTFARLYKISSPINDDAFYDAIVLLTKNKFGVLEQQFEALHPRDGFKLVPDKQQILDDIKEQTFYNPFTGQELSEQEFGEQVITFFSPTKKWVEAISNDR